MQANTHMHSSTRAHIHTHQHISAATLRLDIWIHKLALPLVTQWVYTHAHMHAHTLSRAHCTTRWKSSQAQSRVSSLLFPLPLAPEIKHEKKKGTLPIQKSLFMRYYHSYRTKPWMWPSPLRTLKGQEKKFQTRVHNSSWKRCKKKKKKKNWKEEIVAVLVFHFLPKQDLPFLYFAPKHNYTAFAQLSFFFSQVFLFFCFAFFTIVHSWTTLLQCLVQHLHQWHQHSQYHSYQKQHFAQSPLPLSTVVCPGVFYLGGK